MSFEPKFLFELTVDGANYRFTKQHYTVDDSVAIVIDEESDDYVGPYGVLSINLSDYGMIPTENGIFINHDMKDSKIFKAFYERACDKDFGMQVIYFGMATSYEVKLLPNIL